MNIKDLWCTKNENIFFVSHKNDILFIYFFEEGIILLLLQNNKDIWPWHNILNNIQNKSLVLHVKKNLYRIKKFDVAQKIIWCWQKQVDVHEKAFHVNENKSMLHRRKYFMSKKTWWCCTKKIFHVEKNKMMLHKKNILCSKKLLSHWGQQKQWALNFFENCN